MPTTAGSAKNSRSAADAEVVRPSNNHAVVLVSSLNRATMRALGYAKATRPAQLIALTVNLDDADTRALQDEWDRHDIDIPLTVIASPYREITRPILGYIRRIGRQSPRDVITVFIPEYVVGHWWERLLHNQSSLRLKTRLLFPARGHRRERPVPATVRRDETAGRSPHHPHSQSCPTRRTARRSISQCDRAPAATPTVGWTTSHKRVRKDPVAVRMDCVWSAALCRGSA